MRRPSLRSLLRLLASTCCLHAVPAWPAPAAADDLGKDAAVELPWVTRLTAVEARLMRSDDRTPVAAVPWMADALPPVESPSLLHGLPRRADWRLSLHWPLPGDWSIGLVPGVAVDADTYGRRFSGGTLALVLGRRWTPKWRTFIDMASSRRTAARTEASPLALDAGLSYIASPAVQFDFVLTRGLAAEAPSVSAGAGIAAKF